MRTWSQALAQVSSDQKTATEHMAKIQTQAASDSRLLKSLTILATLYLPASLVAVCVYAEDSIYSDNHPDYFQLRSCGPTNESCCCALFLDLCGYGSTTHVADSYFYLMDGQKILSSVQKSRIAIKS